jgi:hypothetical protein
METVMKSHRLLWSLLSGLALAANAVAAQQDEAATLRALRANSSGQPAIKFSLQGIAGRINSWAAIGTQAVAVWPKQGQGYLLELNGPCQTLPYAVAIGFSNTADFVYAGNDSILIKRENLRLHVGGSMESEQCLIDTIRLLNKEGLKMAQKYLHEGTLIHRDPPPAL